MLRINTVEALKLSGCLKMELEKVKQIGEPNDTATTNHKKSRLWGSIKRLFWGNYRLVEFGSNPLLRSYIDYRARLVSLALKVQSGIAIISAVTITQLSKVVETTFGTYGLALTLLGIPAISFILNKKLQQYSHSGWKDDYPSLDFTGEWNYFGQFAVASISHKLSASDRAGDLNFLNKTFHGKYENGTIKFDQDIFGLQIRSAVGKVGDVDISWHSLPAEFDERKVSWAFRGMILWPLLVELNQEFNGIEHYNVVEWEPGKRPIVMLGNLTGCVQEANEFALNGNFIFWRKDYYDTPPEIVQKYLGIDKGVLSNQLNSAIA
jgi:hypothetical protein